MSVLPQLERELLAAHHRLGKQTAGWRRPLSWPPLGQRLGARVGESILLVTGVAVVAVVVVVIASAGGRSTPPAGPAVPRSAAAALDQAERAAAAGTFAPRLRPGQAWYTGEVERHVSPALGQVPKSVISSIWGKWNAAGTSPGIVYGIGEPHVHAAGFGTFQLATFTNPERAVHFLSAPWAGYWEYSTGGGHPAGDHDVSPFTRLAKAAALLADAPLRPTVRAAVFRAIANLPGLIYLGAARDPLGRQGVAVAAEGSPRALDVNGPQRYRFELIFDPSTGRVLGFRTIAVTAVPSAHVTAGALMLSSAYQHAAVISASEVPALLCRLNASPRSPLGRCLRTSRHGRGHSPA